MKCLGVRSQPSVGRVGLCPDVSGAIALAAMTCALFCCGARSANANPVPPGIVFTHIHEDDGGDFCTGLPVSSCDDIVQTTGLTGTLAFDFLAMPWGGGGLDPFFYTDIYFTVQWTEGWEFVGAQGCGSGAVEISQQDDQVTISIENLLGAPEAETLIGLGRVILSVTSEGSVWLSDLGWNWGPYWTEGRAGVECGDCTSSDCTPRVGLLRPAPTPRVLELTADQDGMATGQFHVDFEGADPDCDEFLFEFSASWMTVDIGQATPTPWGPRYDVTVLADATGLASGTHDAWIEIHAPTCHECEHVYLIVPDGPSPIRPGTWSGVKARFR